MKCTNNKIQLELITRHSGIQHSFSNHLVAIAQTSWYIEPVGSGMAWDCEAFENNVVSFLLYWN